jgi:hypothetical protein
VQEQLSLPEMLSFLKKVDDETWGKYAVSREPLRNRIPETRKIEMIRGSIRCGEEYAGRILRENGNVSPREIAEQFGLSVRFSDLPMTDKRVLFAQFTPPNQIEIMQEPMKEYKTVLEGATAEDCSRLPTVEKIQNILLGHEIFHYLEDRDEKEIYTRTEKIRLWHFLCFQNNSTVGALSEIAGMAFTKSLNCLSYSPFLLDVLLFFGYNPDEARNIYRDVKSIFMARNEETRNW